MLNLFPLEDTRIYSIQNYRFYFLTSLRLRFFPISTSTPPSQEVFLITTAIYRGTDHLEFAVFH